MPEIGTVRKNPASNWPAVWVGVWRGSPPLFVQGWAPSCLLSRGLSYEQASNLVAAIDALADGTIIDIKQLPEVVVLQGPAAEEIPPAAEATQLDDSTMAALFAEAGIDEQAFAAEVEAEGAAEQPDEAQGEATE